MSDKLLPEDVEVADLVLIGNGSPEADLDGGVGLGTIPREPPITDVFVTELTLSKEAK